MAKYSSDEAIADVGAAAYADLVLRFRELAGVVDVVSAERSAIWNEIKRREAEISLRARLGELSDEDKAIYRALLT